MVHGESQATVSYPGYEDLLLDFDISEPLPAIALLNSQNFTDSGAYPDSNTYTQLFDPDDDTDALVVILTTEALGATADVAWDGVPMTQVFPLTTNDPVGVYYLNNPANLGSANISVTVTRNPSGGNINGIGFTVMALDTTDDLGITPTAYRVQTGANSVEPINLYVASDESFVVAGFSSSDGVGAANITASANLTQLLKSDLGSVQGFFGYEENVSAGTNIYQFTYGGTTTFATAVAFNIETPGQTFAGWISGYDVGILDGPGDDPDGDGIDNGVENFFGTHPGEFSQGLLAEEANPLAGTFTFVHPRNASPAADLTATYRWSTDLATFHLDGEPGSGITVSFIVEANTPAPGLTRVTATVFGPTPARLFFDVKVTGP
jgi:hypothetical protein